jgi:hypothetical protein
MERAVSSVARAVSQSVARVRKRVVADVWAAEERLWYV